MHLPRATLPTLASALQCASAYSPESQYSGPPTQQFITPGKLTGTHFGHPCINATYDYVIVGGGLAGSVVATRLALSNASLTIAVVEAGGFSELSNGNWSQIPYYSTQYVGGDPDDWQPLIDWGLVTVPQVNGKRIHYAQGRSLGGSSTRNQMLWHRATAGSYQQWADHVGDQSYTFENMLPFFRKSTSFSAPNMINRAANASANYTLGAYEFPGGPLQISFPAYAQPISSFAASAFAAAGFPAAQDFSSGNLSGYGYMPFSIDPNTGTRSSAEASFLHMALQQTNLTIYQSTMAKQILFDSSKRAIGVKANVMGIKPFVLSARKEVIISAGAWHSPQMLMVSGIGPRATLEKYNISVVSALEGVGQNMWDTTNIGGPIYEVNVPSMTTFASNTVQGAAATEQYLRNASGPFTNMGGDFWAWEKLPQPYRANLSATALSQLSQFASDWPNVEYVLNAEGGTLVATDASKNYATIGALLVSTVSRGNMTISSSDNADAPVINPNWLLHETDQEVAVQAYHRAREIWRNMGNVTLGDEVAPGANVTTDAELLAYIKANISPIHHGSSSCAMGMTNNSQTVVDSRGRVLGVTGLRVIDSSSFPFTPPGHTQGTTYGHAEKLVQDVIDDA